LNTGKAYRDLGKAEEAKEMFTKSHAIFLKVLGLDHPHTKMAAASKRRLA
jgi:hypothetical protein